MSNFSEKLEPALKRTKPEILSPENKELKEKLEMMWTVCPERGHGQEHDQFIDGIDSDEAGAQRVARSGEDSSNGTGVRIRFIQPKVPASSTNE